MIPIQYLKSPIRPISSLAVVLRDIDIFMSSFDFISYDFSPMKSNKILS